MRELRVGGDVHVRVSEAKLQQREDVEDVGLVLYALEEDVVNVGEQLAVTLRLKHALSREGGRGG